MSNWIPFSKRGLPIVFTGDPLQIFRPVITVELYSKWYSLQLVKKDGKVEELPFPTSESFTMLSSEPAYVDHVPNPAYVMAYAEKHCYEIDEVALEIMVGRWHQR